MSDWWSDFGCEVRFDEDGEPYVTREDLEVSQLAFQTAIRRLLGVPVAINDHPAEEWPEGSGPTGF